MQEQKTKSYTGRYDQVFLSIVTFDEEYLKEMPKVYQINLIFENSNSTSIDKYNLCSLMTKKVLTKKIEIFNVYVDKLKEMYHNSNNKLTNKPALISLRMTKEELKERKDENMFYENYMQN